MIKIYYNSIIARILLPFTKYKTLMFFGFICTKYTRDRGVTDEHVNHEAIHVEQYKEITAVALILASVLSLFFGWYAYTFVIALTLYYMIYLIEKVISIVHHFFAGSKKSIGIALGESYANSMFEMESKDNESDLEYIKGRKQFAWIKYFGKI